MTKTRRYIPYKLQAYYYILIFLNWNVWLSFKQTFHKAVHSKLCKAILESYN